MPGIVLSVPGGATGIMNPYMQCTPQDPETSMLWQKMFCYEFRARNLQASEFGQSVNGGLWPSGNCLIGDPVTFVCVDGNDSEGSSMGNMSYFEQWDVSLGNQSQKYILGQCRDINAIPIGGAIMSKSALSLMLVTRPLSAQTRKRSCSPRATSFLTRWPTCRRRRWPNARLYPGCPWRYYWRR